MLDPLRRGGGAGTSKDGGIDRTWLCLPAVFPECAYSFVCVEICSQGQSTDSPGFLRPLKIGPRGEVALPDPRRTAPSELVWEGASPLLWPIDC